MSKKSVTLMPDIQKMIETMGKIIYVPIVGELEENNSLIPTLKSSDGEAGFPGNAEVNCIPTGEVLGVKGTPFDFSTKETLGERFVSGHQQVKKFNGFDRNFVLV